MKKENLLLNQEKKFLKKAENFGDQVSSYKWFGISTSECKLNTFAPLSSKAK